MNAFEKGKQQGMLDRARNYVNKEAYYADYFTPQPSQRRYASGYRAGWHGFDSETVSEWAA